MDGSLERDEFLVDFKMVVVKYISIPYSNVLRAYTFINLIIAYLGKPF